MAKVREGDREKTDQSTGDASFLMQTGAQIRSAIKLRHHGKSKRGRQSAQFGLSGCNPATQGRQDQRSDRRELAQPDCAGSSGRFQQIGRQSSVRRDQNGRADHYSAAPEWVGPPNQGGRQRQHPLAARRSSTPPVAPGRRPPALGAARSRNTPTLLPNGHVLTAGGLDGSASLSTAQYFVPDVGSWYAADSLSHARQAQSASLLSDCRGLPVGGEDAER
jgi:hypothetical protein